MKQQLRFVIFLFGTGVYAQVGIGTAVPNNSAQLEIVSSNKGLLIPRLNLASLTDGTSISNGNVEGLVVYNISAIGMPPGFYYWSSGQWNKLLNKKDLPISSGPGAPTAVFPANPVSGNIYVDENTGEIYTFKGGTWLIQSAVSTDPGNIIIEGTDRKAFLDAVIAADKLGKDVTSSDGSILGVQNKAALVDMNLQVKVDNSSIEVNPVNGLQVKDSGITPPKIVSGGIDKVLVTDATGAVAWINKDAFETVVDMVTIEGLGTIASPLLVKDLGIVTAKLAADAVTSAKILNETILSEDIKDGEVKTVDIADDAVTTIKIVDGAVTSAKILNETILSEDIKDGEVKPVDIESGGNNKVLVTDGLGAVTWIDKDAFGAYADNATIEGSGTASDPFKVKDLGIITDKLAADAVTSAKILNETILSEDIKDGEVKTADIADDAVTTIKIVDGAVTSAKILNETILSEDIKDGEVKTADIADDAVTTIKIVDGAVSSAKILNETILSEDIKDGEVKTVDIATGGINKVLVTDGTGTVLWLDKNEFGAVADDATITGLGTTTSPFLVKDLGIVTAKLANDAVTTAKILNETILSEDIKDGEVKTADIADDAVTTIKIVDGAVTSAKILNETILSEDIKDGVIKPVDIESGGNSKVLVTDVSGAVTWIDKDAFGAIADNVTIEGEGTTLLPFKVKDLGIVTAKLAANAVTTAKLANDAVTTVKIVDANVTPAKIAPGLDNTVLVTDVSGIVTWINKSDFGAIADGTTIEGEGTTLLPFKVKDSGITTDKLADDAVTTIKIVDDAVNSAKIENESILSVDIKDGEV
ncbi:hypothetical protein, partial [Flavobacterium sp.]|uniref:hypothetical protein n=1 Tax=Flavobacterium sp. TaxID=239 RepID=UPI003C32B8CC